MVKGTNPQFAFQGFESRLDVRQLHIALPQDGGVLTHQVGAQQIMTVLRLGLLQLGLVHLEMETLPRDRLAFGRHLDLDETCCASRLLLGGAQAQQQLIATRAAAAHRSQLPQQPGHFLAPHRSLFEAPPFALGQYIQLALFGEQFHFHRLPHLLPGPIQPLPFVLPDLAPPRAHQVKNLTARSAHPPPARLRWECRGPSPTPAALDRRWPRSCPERRAASSYPRCSRPSLRRPGESLRA